MTRLILAHALVLSLLCAPVFAGRHKVENIPRDANGRIKRSYAVKREFMRKSGFKRGLKGYVVDHIIPLKRGGKDEVQNLQWQTIEEAKAKDVWE